MRKLIIFLVLLLCAGAVDSAEVIDSFDNQNMPVLNDELQNIGRKLRKAKDLSSSYDVTGVLPLANGGTGEALTDPGADRIIFWDDSDGDIEWLEAGDNISITGNKLNVAASANDNTSNVLFQYQASVDSTNADYGEVQDTVLVGSAVAGTYRYFKNHDGTTPRTAFKTKWKKIAGIDTITVYAQGWVNGSGGGRNVEIKIDVGGANVTLEGTDDQNTPEWLNDDIDVSGLSDGTAYDVTVTFQISASGTQSYLGSLIAFGS